MSTLIDRLARHRVGYFFEQLDWVAVCTHRAAAWRAVSTSIRWATLPESEWALVPVYWGDVLDRELALRRFGQRMVVGMIFGVPTEPSCARACAALGKIRLPGTLGTWPQPPRPDDPAFSFSIGEMLTHETVVRLDADGEGPERHFDAAAGLTVVRASGEDEEIWINMRAGDIDMLAPGLVRMFGRNLGTWLKEPRVDDSTERQLAHAEELIWAGAPMLASIVAARALEGVLRKRLTDADTVLTAEEKMLGKIIKRAKLTGVITPEDAKRMFDFSKVRNASAHAVARDDSLDVGEQVGEFVAWFREFIAPR